MHKHFRISLSLFVMGLFGLVGASLPAAAQAATVNSLIKSNSFSSVYWYNSDGKRYAFPNEKTFYTWFTDQDFSRVVIVSDTELASIQLAGNITYHPGVKLVKIQTDPKVYAVSRNGVLHWVTTEAIAQSLYGADWNKHVDDIPDVFFFNYTVGSSITAAGQYDPNTERLQAATPNLNIGTSNPAPGAFTGSATVTVNQTSIASGGPTPLTINVMVNNPSALVQNLTINIYQEAGNVLVKTCSGQFSCSLSIPMTTQVPGTYRYYATVTNQNGQALPVSYSPVVTVTQSTTLSGQPGLYYAPSPATVGSYFDVVASINNPDTAVQNLTIYIYDERTSQPVKTCTGAFSCSAHIYADSSFSANFYATIWDNTGRFVRTGNVLVTANNPSYSY